MKEVWKDISNFEGMKNLIETPILTKISRMKPLICVPAVTNPHVTQECLDAVVNQSVDIILCANGATQEVLDLFEKYREVPSIKDIWILPENIFVNPVWNKFVEFFLANEQYTHVGLLSSDVILHHHAFKVLDMFEKLYPTAVPIASETNKVNIFRDFSLRSITVEEIPASLPGFFVWLNRDQAKVSFPIPERLKIWFGDTWLYTICMEAGYKNLRINELLAFHHGSQTLKELSNTNSVIEEDKAAWEKIKIEMNEKIRSFKKN